MIRNSVIRISIFLFEIVFVIFNFVQNFVYFFSHDCSFVLKKFVIWIFHEWFQFSNNIRYFFYWFFQKFFPQINWKWWWVRDFICCEFFEFQNSLRSFSRENWDRNVVYHYFSHYHYFSRFGSEGASPLPRAGDVNIENDQKFSPSRS